MTKPFITIYEGHQVLDGQPKPAHAQPQKAKWRGEIKIQAELEPGTLRVKRRGTFMVTSEDGSVFATFTSSKALRTLLNSRAKAYFKATLLGDGTLDIREEVPTRPW